MNPTYGQRIRRARLRKAMSQDDLALVSGVSKAYLSLMETGRLTNPPADEKLSRLESVLDLPKGELLHEAHLARTPAGIRAVLSTLAGGAERPTMLDLDSAYLTGVLAKAVEARTANVEPVTLVTVPVINRVSAGGLSTFDDLSHPKADAEHQVGCPDVADPAAFACRVDGDSMAPKYAPGDVVIFSPAAEVRAGDDCYVRMDDGQTTFKRVYFETDDSGQRVARLQPRNSKYAVRVVPAESVSGVYRAVFRYQQLNGD